MVEAEAETYMNNKDRAGVLHLLQADDESTWKLGYFDHAAEPVLHVESGDRIRYESIPSGYGGNSASVRTVEDAMALRSRFPEWGPHTVVGPVSVEGAVPGDVLEVRFQDLIPASPAVNVCLPGELGLGSKPAEYPDGFVRRFEFERDATSVQLNDDVSIPLAPFPGIVAVQPGEPGSHSTMPPGVFGGNMDLKDLTAGSRLFLPVHQPGGMLYVGDFHAGQGDGEVNLQALEMGAERLDVQVLLHSKEHIGLVSPIAETRDEWIILGFGSDIDSAFQDALGNVLRFLTSKADQTADDAYCLASVAIDFRMTQVVSTVKGVHGVIPKSVFGSRITERLEGLFGQFPSGD